MGWNKHDKNDCQIAKSAIHRVYEELKEEYCLLPARFEFEYKERLGIEICHTNLLYIGRSIDYANHKNKNNKYGSIVPDGGAILLTKYDNAHYKPMVHYLISCAEMKYQGRNSGNAIERMYKNSNAILNTYFPGSEINPYIVCCHGDFFSPLNNFEINKLRDGCGFEIPNIDIHSESFKGLYGDNDKLKKFCVTTKVAEYNENELYGIFMNVAHQAMDYNIQNIDELKFMLSC